MQGYEKVDVEQTKLDFATKTSTLTLLTSIQL